MSKKEKDLKKLQMQINQKQSELTKKENMLNMKEAELNQREMLLNKKESELIEKEAKKQLTKKIKNLKYTSFAEHSEKQKVL